MSRPVGVISCLFALLTTSASAQSTTEDGIRAVLRSEYQAAVRILRPLADETTPPEPAGPVLLGFVY